jgi:threonyl-tRNA synthetase
MDQEKLSPLRHSTAHLLAAAVLELYPGAKRAIGPSIETGFYYDFEFPENVKISEEDLPKIEAKMAEILKNWNSIEGREVSVEEAKGVFKDEPYKLELIEDFSKDGKTLTIYKSGHYEDLCKGGHSEDPSKEIGAFKLLSLAGAYWKGSEKNKMLTRIYGTAFTTQKELEEYLVQVEEMKKRDHRKLGRELDLFTFSELVGAGLPLFTPKGTFIKMALQEALLEISKPYGYSMVSIPHIAKIDLYKTSGHAQKFGDELFKVISHYDEEFVMKPVNCPHHTQIYQSRPRSYRDLPLRYMESTMQYRDEKPGEIGGLTRTRGFTVDDAHLFITVDQIEEEVKNICHIIREFYKGLGMWGKHWVSLSVRDHSDFSKYVGEEADWDKAEAMLEKIANELELGAKKVEGEAAIYGPKLDFMFTDSLGRERQLATVQLDFAMPKRFGLEYTDPEGQIQTPVMIHRAILGSYERFMAILIEHFGGAFPTWLSPTQVMIVPITDRSNEYGQKLLAQFKEAGIRAEIDERSEKMQAKIRDAQLLKIPYMVIIGDREQEASKVAVRTRSGENLTPQPFEDFLTSLKQEITDKK